ncbi:MAG: YbaN family protein [Deltaproteobacteria bacterium]|nr:YbaN family protein [Deltaproteobacteria bacterium]MDL1986286.1 YbaN family protein [Deltaproteobacteria bacterium]
MKNVTISSVITHRSRAIRICLIITGIFFVSVGTLGIVLPLLPTTPFLVLASMCFSRSSERFHNWLLNNKWFGAYIKNYRAGKGISLRQKIVVLSLLILTIGYSCIFLLDHIAVRVILVLVAIGISIHILRIPTLGLGKTFHSK